MGGAGNGEHQDGDRSVSSPSSIQWSSVEWTGAEWYADCGGR